MSVEGFSAEVIDSETVAVQRLRVVAEADPTALARVLEHFQNLNIIPRRVTAELGSGDRIDIQVDVTGLPEGRLSLIAAKLEVVPAIVNAYCYPI
jgi:hypothetical protein